MSKTMKTTEEPKNETKQPIVFESEEQLKSYVRAAVEEILTQHPAFLELKTAMQRLQFSMANLQRKADESHYRIDSLIQKNKLISEI